MIPLIRRAPLLLVTAFLALAVYLLIAFLAFNSTGFTSSIMVLATGTLFPVFIGALFLWQKALYHECPIRATLKEILAKSRLEFDPNAPAEELALIAETGGKITTKRVVIPSGILDIREEETIVELYDLNGLFLGECGELHFASETPLI